MEGDHPSATDKNEADWVRTKTVLLNPGESEESIPVCTFRQAHGPEEPLLFHLDMTRYCWFSIWLTLPGKGRRVSRRALEGNFDPYKETQFSKETSSSPGCHYCTEKETVT
ncbi:uncharacterized protein LOC143653172 [Tamandua tetradactyla]|uniref:uncharacterized protein LOC143653172 n=1 Tax=Tamandua tetradactyla TaxID=48850 RepID=UPI0040545D28